MGIGFNGDTAVLGLLATGHACCRADSCAACPPANSARMLTTSSNTFACLRQARLAPLDRAVPTLQDRPRVPRVIHLIFAAASPPLTGGRS